MAFNPFQEKGMPIDKQFRSWEQLNSTPYDKNQVDPYTRCRVILANGLEVEGVFFKHQMARHCNDMELKRQLSLTRRVEQQQQKAINWLSPPDESVLETTIGYEQVAVDLTAWIARNEPDPYVKAALDFALLEDFDHLYRYANLLEMTEGKKADAITKQFTEITVGRPTAAEHRHPFDDVRKNISSKKADPFTLMNTMTIVAAEQQTMNFYMNVGNKAKDMLGRGVYLEIAQIEEQHVTHYESLMDPNCTWFEMMVMHEYNEVYIYHSLMEQEVDPRIKQIWQMHLEQELEHLRLAGEAMKKFEKRDPQELFPTATLPKPIIFQSNIDYVRDILASQADFQAVDTEFVPADRAPRDGRYGAYQGTVNAGQVPTELVIQEHIKKLGSEYRQELQGPHPVERFRLQ